ncbi:hypothetical protein [Streptomyces platensis]|uniref:hypothetical protein n=1 Tax=Streptomyces platensis TaxID=58346 RepID=UPI001F21EB8F|nr:hypothetical protein [Streptomyces platensis]MCF3143640.1 hypothetical protein [Streptomyces platensis]
MHYATTKSNTRELHRQDAGKAKGYCGKFAPNPVDPESASMGLAARILRTCRKCDEIAEDRRRAELSLADGLFVTELAASSAPAPVAEDSLFGAEDLADLYVAPKRHQPRRSAPPEDGGLFGDAELAAAQDDTQRPAVDEYAPASPTEADAAGADARDRAADARDRAADVRDLADMVAEAESRARVQAQMDREDARKTVPTLGWSDQIHAAMRAAAAGRLILGADGAPRIVGAKGGKGHRTRADRLLMLVGAGMLNRARRGNPLMPTPDGVRALKLANLCPRGVHATDREAYAARLRAARKPGVSGEEAKNTARTLPPLPHGVEEERRVKAMSADMRRSVERVEEIRRRIDERAEQMRREEAERKRARSASKTPAREGSGRLRHVFCGPDPRLVAQWEAERAEAAQRPAAAPQRRSSASATAAPPSAAPTPGEMPPTAPPRLPARPIGHPRAATSATGVRLASRGIVADGRWPMSSTPVVADFVAHRPPATAAWPMADMPTSAIGHGRRRPVTHDCAACKHSTVADAPAR